MNSLKPSTNVLSIPEIIFMIISHMNRKDGFLFGLTCHMIYNAYVKKFIMLNPEKYIFYTFTDYSRRHVQLYEFDEIRKTSYRWKVMFNKKYSTCEKCQIIGNVKCSDQTRHKSRHRYLKLSKR